MKVKYDPLLQWLNSPFGSNRYLIYFQPREIDIRRNLMTEHLYFKVTYGGQVEIRDYFHHVLDWN